MPLFRMANSIRASSLELKFSSFFKNVMTAFSSMISFGTMQRLRYFSFLSVCSAIKLFTSAKSVCFCKTESKACSISGKFIEEQLGKKSFRRILSFPETVWIATLYCSLCLKGSFFLPTNTFWLMKKGAVDMSFSCRKK